MVVYLYLDESGTLGLAKGPANYFVMAVLRTAEPASLRQTIERARGHALPSRLRRLPEIKASLASDQFRGLVYRRLAQLQDQECWLVGHEMSSSCLLCSYIVH